MRDVYSPKDLDTPIISFRYIKKLKEWLEENGKTKEDFTIIDRPVLEPLNTILHTTKMMMKAIAEKFKGGKPIVFLTGGNNFRHDYAIGMPYKGNRWSEEKREAAREAGEWLEWLDKTEEKHTVPIRPFYEEEIKQYLIKTWKAIMIEGEEADDALGYTQYKMQRNFNKGKGPQSVIVSVDKDLKMIAGHHQDLSAMDIDVTWVTPLQGNLNFYSQILSGDRVDNIPGIHRVGKKTADKFLKDCTTTDEMMQVVFDVYKDKDPDVTDGDILYRARLLWIRRKENQEWAF